MRKLSFRRCVLLLLVLVVLLPAASESSPNGGEPTDDAVDADGRPLKQGGKGGKGRAPSCGGCDRRESAQANKMRLQSYGRIFVELGPIKSSFIAGAITLGIGLAMQHFLSRDTIKTLVYVMLYLLASPTAILVNKILMKDYGFGYPVLVSSLGQLVTAVCAYIAVKFCGVSIETGKRVDKSSMIFLGGCSALALVLGQYPYLYLTVAFIQMLKAFSPAYMVCFLYCLGVEYPSRRVVRSLADSNSAPHARDLFIARSPTRTPLHTHATSSSLARRLELRSTRTRPLADARCCVCRVCRVCHVRADHVHPRPLGLHRRRLGGRGSLQLAGGDVHGGGQLLRRAPPRRRAAPPEESKDEPHRDPLLCVLCSPPSMPSPPASMPSPPASMPSPPAPVLSQLLQPRLDSAAPLKTIPARL